MSGIQQVGVQATFDTTNFVNGVNTYIAALDRMVQHTRAAASSMVVQPQIVGLQTLSQDIQNVNNQVRLLRSSFQHLNKQQTPFATITPQVNAFRTSLANTNVTLRGTGNVLNHVTRNAQAAASSIAQAKTQATGLAAALNKIQTVAKNVNVTFSQTAKSARSAGTAFQTGIGVILGTAVLHGIRGFTEGFIGLSRAIAENIGFWERLSLSIAFFETRTLDSDAATLSYAERVRMVGQEARETTLWIQQLAIASPFTSKDVGNVFRVSQAYGLTTAQAKELLPLMLDLGSAAGFNSDVLERVALALGQVQARGKLTGEEIRQLGNAGVPIRDILVKNLGIANEEFEDFVEEGAFTAEVVMPLIIKSLKEFAGASEAVTKNTLTGLANAFKELVEIGQVDLFQGIADSIKATMQEIVAALQDPRVRPALVALGQFLGSVFVEAIREIREALGALVAFFSSISPETYKLITLFVIGATAAVAFSIGLWAVGAAVAALTSPLGLVIVGFGALFTLLAQDDPIVAIKEFFTGLTRAISRILISISDFVGGLREMATAAKNRFREAADEAEMFGSRLLQMFAFGMEQSLRFVEFVIDALGQLLAFWLAPGSPPRVAPNIDDWGTETANVWLQGFTKADFGILKDITSSLRDFLTSLVKPGDLQGELNVIETVIGSNELIQRAIQQIKSLGQVSSDTFNQIRAAAGAAGEMIVGYLQRYQALAAASRAVEVAQAALNAITAKYTAILKPLQDRLEEINDTQKATEDAKEIARLQSIIASKYVTDAYRKQAALELETLLLEQQIAATEDRQEAEEGAAETALENAEANEQAAEDALEVYQEQIELATEANELEKDRLEAVQAIIEEEKRLAEERAKQKTPLQIQLEIYKLQREELNSMIEVERARLVLMDSESTEAERAAAALIIQSENLESIQRGIDISKLGGSLESIKAIQIVMADLVKGGEKDSPFAGGGLLDAEETVTNIAEQIAAWDTNVLNFRTSINETFGELMEWFNQVNENLPPFLKLFTGEEKPRPAAGNRLDPTTDMTDTFFDVESFPIAETGLKVLGIYAFVKAIGALVTVWDLVKKFKIIEGIWWLSKAIAAVGLAALNNPVTWLVGAVGLSLALIFNIGGARDKMDELDKKFKEAQETSNQPFFKGLRDNQAWVAENIGPLPQRIGEKIGEWWKWFDEPFIKASEKFETWATNLGPNIVKWFREHIDFEKVKQIGTDILTGILGFDPIEVARLIGENCALMVQKFKEWLGIASPSTKMQDEVGTPMLEGIVEAFVDGIGQAIIDVTTELWKIATAITDPAKLQEWWDIGGDIADNIISGITSFIYGSKDFVANALEWLRQNVFDSTMFTNFFNKASQLGTYLVHGIKGGIDSALNVIRTAVANIIAIFPDWLQKWFLGEDPVLPEVPPVTPPELPPGVQDSSANVQSTEATKSLTQSLDALNRTILMTTLPTQQMVTTPIGTNAATTVNNFNLNTHTNAPSSSIIRDFNMLQAMAGV